MGSLGNMRNEREMTATPQEYDKAKDELAHLEQWLARLQKTSPLPAKGLTKPASAR
jgi:hypothetical protein